MHVYKFHEVEDRFISLLDAGTSPSKRAAELDAVRVQMRHREKARLKFLLQQAKLAEARL